MIKAWRRRLRDAFRFYQVDLGRGAFTMTEVRGRISYVVKAAQRFVTAPTWDTADEFLRRLELDRNVDLLIQRALSIEGEVWVDLKQNLRFALAGRLAWAEPITVAKSSVQIASILARISSLDAPKIVPKSGLPRDPALYALVSQLALLWSEITGRSPWPTTDVIKETHSFPFFDWLSEMLLLARVGDGAEISEEANNVIDAEAFALSRDQVLTILRPRKNPTTMTSRKT